MNTLKVTNHLQFACFDYKSVTCPHHALGDILINKGNEIGVILQIHESGEYRTDMFGNCSLSEIRSATLGEITDFRPELLTSIAFEKPNYYDDELSNIDLPNGEFKIKVQHHGGASTKWMNVNADSIPAVIRFLQRIEKKNKGSV